MIFMSYSRRDRDLVAAVNELLVAADRETFVDTTSIPAGAPWRAAITTNIEECERMFVFWCRHASASTEVQREYSTALERDKTVVPIALDGTSLPPRLSQYNALTNARFKRWHRLGTLERWAWPVGGALILSGGILLGIL